MAKAGARRIKKQIISLLAKARARTDFAQESNYEYVQSRIHPDYQQLLEEVFWEITVQDSDVRYARGRDSCSRAIALIVDDDSYVARDYGLSLNAHDFYSYYAHGPDEALGMVRSLGDIFDVVIIDIRMPVGDFLSAFKTVGGTRTGVALAEELADLAPSARLVALSNSVDALDISWFEASENRHYCNKADFSPKRFPYFISSTVMKDYSRLRPFIIHGHDLRAVQELKSYLQETLGFAEPIVLWEQKSRGMTVIEKLEYYMPEADIVFALFTPDDFVGESAEVQRARQNVLVEFGMALGMLGRKSGRIFYLYKEGVEIPSDLTGVIYIDITHGLASADKQLRRELEDYLG